MMTMIMNDKAYIRASNYSVLVPAGYAFSYPILSGSGWISL